MKIRPSPWKRYWLTYKGHHTEMKWAGTFLVNGVKMHRFKPAYIDVSLTQKETDKYITDKDPNETRINKKVLDSNNPT
jgi:hypothetical protein